MKRLAIVALAACGGSGDYQPDGSVSTDAGGDAGTSCSVYVAFDPETPLAYAGQVVRAKALVTGLAGVPSYTWSIRHGSTGDIVAHELGAPDGSAVDFVTETPDSYDAFVDVSGCPSARASVNAEAPGAMTSQLRLRVFAHDAPPQESFKLFKGGTPSWALGIVGVEPGVMASGTTTANAYLRFMKTNAPETYVETFSGPDGAFSVRTAPDPYDVLIVPSTPGLAPRRVASWQPGLPLPAIDAGFAITGSVLDPDDQPVANAQVQIVVDGVPTSLGRTDTDGLFTVRAADTVGAMAIEVAAPAASGLPRLVASSPSWSFSQSVTIEYAPTIAIADAGGRVVQRAGAPLANAHVALVGTFAGGTISSGSQSVNAAAEVRAMALTDGAGVLPTLRAPARVLTVAAAPPNGDVTITTIDLAAPATSIAMPSPMPATTQLQSSTGDPLAGAVLEAVPSGVFALAGMGTVRAVADANGNATALLAPNASYELHLRDPRGHEATRLAAATTIPVTTSTIAASYRLRKAVKLRGTLSLLGTPQPVGSATVQLLCTQCTGTARALPLAEGRVSPDGRFEVAVPDPGTMPP